MEGEWRGWQETMNVGGEWMGMAGDQEYGRRVEGMAGDHECGGRVDGDGRRPGMWGESGWGWQETRNVGGE